MRALGLLFLSLFVFSCSRSKDINLEDYAPSLQNPIIKTEAIEKVKLQDQGFNLRHNVSLSHIGGNRRFEQVFVFEKQNQSYRVSWFAPNYISTLYTAASSARKSTALDQVNKIFYFSEEGNNILLPEFFKTKINFEIFRFVFAGFKSKDFLLFNNENIYTDSKGKLVYLSKQNDAISKILFDESSLEISKVTITDNNSTILFEILERDVDSLPKRIKLTNSDSDLEFIFSKNSNLEYASGNKGKISNELISPSGYREIYLD